MTRSLLRSALAFAGLAFSTEESFNPLAYVDPLIGTANYGNGELRRTIPQASSWQYSIG